MSYDIACENLARDFLSGNECPDGDKTRELHVARLAQEIQDAIEEYLTRNVEPGGGVLAPAADGEPLDPLESENDRLGRVSAVCTCGHRRDSHVHGRVGYKPNPCFHCGCRQFDHDTIEQRVARARKVAS